MVSSFGHKVRSNQKDEKKFQNRTGKKFRLNVLGDTIRNALLNCATLLRINEKKNRAQIANLHDSCRVPNFQKTNRQSGGR
jgi:hypothetical protein